MASRKQHPVELGERAVAMVFELRAESGNSRGSIVRVGERLDINPETLRNWVERAEIDGGQRPGTRSDDKKRIAELERENRELRRANEILKAASMSLPSRSSRHCPGSRPPRLKHSAVLPMSCVTCSPIWLHRANQFPSRCRNARTQAGSWCVSRQRFTVALPAKPPNSM
jgi:transposase